MPLLFAMPFAFHPTVEVALVVVMSTCAYETTAALSKEPLVPVVDPPATSPDTAGLQAARSPRAGVIRPRTLRRRQERRMST